MGGYDEPLSCPFGSSAHFALPRLPVRRSCMGAQPVPTVISEGEALLLGLLLAALVVGLSLGWILSWCCRKVWPDREEGRFSRTGAWARIVSKALRFIRKRRRISLAWANYRNHRLRQLPAGVAEDRLPRQRSDSTEEVRPLREGPAIQNGTHRRRAQSDRHASGRL